MIAVGRRSLAIYVEEMKKLVREHRFVTHVNVCHSLAKDTRVEQKS